MTKTAWQRSWCVLFVCVLLGSAANAPALTQPGSLVWAQTAGGPSLDSGRGIAFDSEENVVVTGFFNRTAQIGSEAFVSQGIDDIFLAKYDPTGQPLWVKQLGGSGSDLGLSLAVDGADNILLTGFFSHTTDFGGVELAAVGRNDVFLAKYDPQGELLWVKGWGGPDLDWGLGVAVDGEGNAFVAGRFRETFTLDGFTLTSAGEDDIFLARFDAEGTLLWADRAGGPGGDEVRSLAVDGTGHMLMVGKFEQVAEFEQTTLVSTGAADAFLAKYDLEGTLVWANAMGGLGADEAQGVAVDGEDNVLLTGKINGDVEFAGTTLVGAGGDDVFIAKYAAAGELQWVRRAGGEGLDGAAGIAVDGAGHALITGRFSEAADFDKVTLHSAGSVDVFIAEYDLNGRLVWVQSSGGPDADQGFSIAAAGAGNLAFTGFFRKTANFGDASLPSAGSADVMVVKLNR